MNYPKISVVTPSYNQGQFIEETINSVLDQGYPNLEYIILDGGSNDNSVEIIKKYEKHLKYWVSEKDKGQSDAINKGLKMCTGDIFTWLNSDDIFEPNALNIVGEYFNSHPECEVVYGDAIWISKEGNLLQYKKETSFSKFIYIYDHNFIPQPSTFFKLDLMNKVGGVDVNLHYSMDMDLWFKLSKHAKMHHINVYLSKMRKYAEQKMIKGRKQADIEDHMVIERHLGRKVTKLERKLLFPFAKTARVAMKVLHI